MNQPQSQPNISDILDQIPLEEKILIKWLLENPDFKERPVDVSTFIEHPDYLNLPFVITGNKGYGCRPRIKKRLIDILDPEQAWEEFVLCCGIGWGKDFAASIVLSYKLYWLGCLKDPSSFYGLSRGSNIHLMLMSINETHARDVLFGEMKARIDNSPWFKRNFKYNPKVNTQMVFPNGVMLIPGNSKDTSFVGYNIFCAIIDEGDDYTSTKNRDDAEEGYNSIKQRIVSRFRGHGLLGMIGSPKTEDGFMMRKFKNFEGIPKRYCAHVPTWDSLIGTPMLSGETFFWDDMKIPIEYKASFMGDPERAMRDLGAKPAKAKEPFFTIQGKIDAMFDAADRLYEYKESDLQKDKYAFGKFVEARLKPQATEYYGHIDLAVNRDKGDRLGFAFGHVVDYVEIDSEMKPVIRIDFAAVFTAPPGSEIQFSDFKALVYYLVEKGFVFEKLTTDSWNSVDLVQSLNARGIPTSVLSVDTSIEPYANLKNAAYEGRVLCHEMPILKSEIERLELVNGEKVDHPAKGSKDCADAVAGVVHNIMISSSTTIINFTPKFGQARIFS